MTPLAYQISQLLLPVCLEETHKMREIYAEPVQSFTQSRARAVKLIIDSLINNGVTIPIANAFKHLAAIYETSPDAKKEIESIIIQPQSTNTLPIYNPFTVVVIIYNFSGHKLLTGVPRIVTHGKHGDTLLLDEDNTVGFPAHYNIIKTEKSEVRLASDEEIEACLMDLSPRQLRTIMTTELFAPIINKLYEAQEELVAVDVETSTDVETTNEPNAQESAKETPKEKLAQLPTFEIGDRVILLGSPVHEVGIVTQVNDLTLEVKWPANSKKSYLVLKEHVMLYTLAADKT